MGLLVEFLVAVGGGRWAVAVDGGRHSLKKKIHHTELGPAF
jgi:hypothetical protein